MCEPVDDSSNSLLESYRASMEEARLNIKHKEDISNLKREKENYAVKSEDNFRKSEQRVREKEDESARLWNRLETMQSYQLDMIAQRRVSNAAGCQPRNEDDHVPVSEDTFSNGIKDRRITFEKSRVNPPKYSQIPPVNDEVIIPSITSTPLVRHSGGNINPESRTEKVTLKGAEQQHW